VLSPGYLASEYCEWEIVEYLKYEHSRAAAGQGVAPVYFVEVPGLDTPGFEQAARLCIELGLAANVEIKPSRGAERITGRVVAEAAQRLWAGAAPAPLLSSFSEEALEEAARAAPGLPRGLLCGVIPDDWAERMHRLGCVSLHCDCLANDRRRIAGIAKRGTPVVCYTINDPAGAVALLAAGAAAVITDRPDLIREA